MLDNLVFKRNLPMIAVLALSLGLASPASAYVDPNIGGQIYQMLYPLFAIVLGVFAFFRQWLVLLWRNLKSFVSNALSRLRD